MTQVAALSKAATSLSDAANKKSGSASPAQKSPQSKAKKTALKQTPLRQRGISGAVRLLSASVSNLLTGVKTSTSGKPTKDSSSAFRLLGTAATQLVAAGVA